MSTARSPAEAEVVASLKRHLLQGLLGGVRPSTVLVDADSSYLRSRFARELEPLARVSIAGGRPDLICGTSTDYGTVVTGFEVKASVRDWLHGLAQARRYRFGVHRAYLALPADPQKLEREAGGIARDSGVGLLALDSHGWREVVQPADPVPQPALLSTTLDFLNGVPLVRQLQLNHPLNFLVVAYLAARPMSAEGVLHDLAQRWPDLRTPGTRRHAVAGAQGLHLVGADLAATAEGEAVADLLAGVGFVPELRPPKRTRLVDAAPAIAAVARLVFLQQPSVRLLTRSLCQAGRPLTLPELVTAASRVDPTLTEAIFYADATLGPAPDGVGPTYNPSAVFKLKQNLWHAGVLAQGAHPSAGKSRAVFRPTEDIWSLEMRRC